VQVGKTANVRATARDEDGDALTYRWSSPQGTVANTGAASSVWTAPAQPGTVRVSMTVTDGKGGTATKFVDIEVLPKPEYKVPDILFAFDKSNLDAVATKTLADLIKIMNDHPEVTVLIEGHTGNLGTDAYNMALSERRAKSVYDYLIKHGIAAGRLEMAHFGESRPTHDNSKEETRKLNRRVTLVVRVP